MHYGFRLPRQPPSFVQVFFNWRKLALSCLLNLSLLVTAVATTGAILQGPHTIYTISTMHMSQTAVSRSYAKLQAAQW